ncbi:hypothetical protein [Spirosoma flavum]|uniref:DUF3575 domain-containing protein n=1 Tax=Spirosoma flavum TaxID=2048557 RepID=A0ABW6AMA0_9BACT
MRTHLLTSIVLISCAILPLASVAQADLPTPVLRKSLWRVGLFNLVRPGFSHELRLTRKVSLLSVANLRTDYISHSEQNQPTIWYRSLTAQASLSGRYYYNLDPRLTAGKNIQYNSGNYLSVGAYYTSPVVAQWGEQSLYQRTYPLGTGNTVNVRFLWGIQRQLPPKRFYYDLSAGLQVNTNKSSSRLHGSFTAQLAIGYCLTK